MSLLRSSVGFFFAFAIVSLLLPLQFFFAIEVVALNSCLGWSRVFFA